MDYLNQKRDGEFVAHTIFVIILCKSTSILFMHGLYMYVTFFEPLSFWPWTYCSKNASKSNQGKQVLTSLAYYAFTIPIKEIFYNFFLQ